MSQFLTITSTHQTQLPRGPARFKTPGDGSTRRAAGEAGRLVRPGRTKVAAAWSRRPASASPEPQGERVSVKTVTHMSWGRGRGEERGGRGVSVGGNLCSERLPPA